MGILEKWETIQNKHKSVLCGLGLGALLFVVCLVVEGWVGALIALAIILGVALLVGAIHYSIEA